MQNTYVKKYGFTIVELLIVIVVIAILATISITAYTNFQQRAKNTAIINAASQSLKMIQAYIVEHGTYPATYNACITGESECQTYGSTDNKTSSSSTFNTNMAKIGILPKSVPSEGEKLYGITYVYDSELKFNNESQPAYLIYHLLGLYRKCGVPGVMSRVGPSTHISSTTGYYMQDSVHGKTLCYVSIPGPAHS